MQLIYHPMAESARAQIRPRPLISRSSAIISFHSLEKKAKYLADRVSKYLDVVPSDDDKTTRRLSRGRFTATSIFARGDCRGSYVRRGYCH